MNSRLEEFIDHCSAYLSSDKEGQEYLKRREISQSSIDNFNLGFFRLDNIKEFSSEVVEDLLQRGILLQSENSKNFFCLGCQKNSGSIVLPFYNAYNDLIAVSFRPIVSNAIIKQKKIRKYWHNAFAKRFFLYGLNKVPRKTKTIVVGEGQFDVIMSHQHGLHNVIGICGVALTDNHVSLISKRATEIVLLFDGDEAGIAAADKIVIKMEKLKKVGGIKFKKAILPMGEDIDSYLRAYGKEKFEKIIKEAESI